jgi:hypothetical protein
MEKGTLMIDENGSLRNSYSVRSNVVITGINYNTFGKLVFSQGFKKRTV